MNGFEEEPASNLGVGTPETNPLAQIFSEEYSFSARIYNIENDPGSAPMQPGIPIEPPTEFPPAEQEPTPAALVPGNPGANMAWFVWTGISPIQISIPSGADVQSIYISGNTSGETIYVTSGYTAGGFMTVSPGYTKDLLPIPPGSPLLTLYVSDFTEDGFASPIYICAYGDVWNPFDQGGGLGTLIWINPQPAPIGSGGFYTNESPNVQLVTIGGTSGVVTINGVQISGGQPGTYTLNPGDVLGVTYGLDLTILTMSNLEHYYPMETITSGYATPDSVVGGAEGQFYSLQSSPPDWTPPKLAASITSDNAPSTEANIPVITVYNPGTSSERGTAFGWQLSAGSGNVTGPQSWLFFFQTTGMFPWDAGPTNPPNRYHDLLLVLPENTGPGIFLTYTDSPLGGYQFVVGGRGSSQAGWTMNQPALGVPHMCVVTWDGTSVLTLQFDLGSPISCTIGGFAQNPPAFKQPHFMGDDNGEAPCQMQISKIAIFDTVLAAQVIEEIYVQATNATNPVYQFYQVLGTS